MLVLPRVTRPPGDAGPAPVLRLAAEKPLVFKSWRADGVKVEAKTLHALWAFVIAKPADVVLAGPEAAL